LKAIRYDHGESRITVESRNSFLRAIDIMRVLENFFLFFRSSIEVVFITALLAAVAYRDG